MRYGIMISLDYENHPYEKVFGLFKRIRLSMVKQGFVMEGRTFTIELPEEHAISLAQDVMNELDDNREVEEESIYFYLKEFYGFDIGAARNLMMPQRVHSAGMERMPRSDHIEVGVIGH